jgi:hypothetical protein
MSAAAEAPAKVLRPAYIVRMRPALAAQIANKAFVRIPWPLRAGDNAPLLLNHGDRIFLVEYAGAETGRADLVGVEGFANAKGFPAGYPEAPGEVIVRRGYCTHRAIDGVGEEGYLAAVGYRAVPTGCAMLDAVPTPAPAEPEPGAHVVGAAA